MLGATAEPEKAVRACAEQTVCDCRMTIHDGALANPAS
ncbi:MAG: hypothetical protein JWM12_4113, partial [Ilumatobacteraceae bacterium]|nr:hypothetical protein [Ilumatobacteraceae bacterium]